MDLDNTGGPNIYLLNVETQNQEYFHRDETFHTS